MKLSISVLTLLLLVACSSPSRDMANNQFPQLVPESVPSDLSGFWTGAMSSYLATLKINSDGTGLFCYSYGTADIIQRIKYVDGKVHIQDGTEMTLQSFDEEHLRLRSRYFTAQDFNFSRDDSLTEASIYCSQAM